MLGLIANCSQSSMELRLFWHCNLFNFLSVDDIPPVISGCEDAEATIGFNVGGAIVSWVEPTATDNSGVATLLSRSRAPGQFFVVGSTPVTYRFVDGSGNIAECTFNVVVIEGRRTGGGGTQNILGTDVLQEMLTTTWLQICNPYSNQIFCLTFRSIHFSTNSTIFCNRSLNWRQKWQMQMIL